MLKDYIKKNQNKLENFYGKVNDIEYLYIKNMINKQIFELILKDLSHTTLNIYAKRVDNKEYNEYDYLLSTGSILLLYNQEEYFIPLTNIPKRSPEDSSLDPFNIELSRDGFTESLNDNITLIKKRLKTSTLNIIPIKCGKKSMTDINIIYLDSLVDKDILRSVIKSIKKLSNDDILSVNELTYNIGKETVVPTLENTGNPEKLSSSLLKGRIGILIDNSPVATIIPSSFYELTEVKDDLNKPILTSLFNRLFIILFIFTSLFLPSIFLVLSSHHPEILSSSFLENLIDTEQKTTFSLIIEIIIVLSIFEFYRLVSTRSSKTVAESVIVIFGGIFIGQNAVESNLIGTVAIIITSLSYISSFAITNNQKLITAFGIFRVFILFMSFVLGLVGFMISSLLVINYLANIYLFNKDYLHPFIPIDLIKIKEWLVPKKE